MQYNGNIGFVFMMGEKGNGKSCLLNNIIDISGLAYGFPERTKGIKMWTRPLYREEEFLNLFFVDV